MLLYYNEATLDIEVALDGSISFREVLALKWAKVSWKSKHEENIFLRYLLAFTNLHKKKQHE